MKVSDTTLNKLDFPRIRDALAERAASRLGFERAYALTPTLPRTDIEAQWQRLSEAVAGPELALGGVEDIRPLVVRVREGNVLEGREILSIAYTLDAAATVKRAIAASERPALGEIAARMRSFDGVLRQVREQLDPDGGVRDDATPKLRDIRRRLNPLRGRIRDKLQQLLERYSDSVQDAIITLRRDRYVIPIRASAQSRVPGIALDQSASGATVFIEPQSVVPMNNELAILEFEERDEVRRILIALGQRLAYEEGLDETIELLADLDLIAASARLAKDWRLAEPTFNDDGAVTLAAARHPLVEGCVPNSLSLDADRRLMIVTGPNAGGKTVLLKTLGLATLMAHSGLFVAATTPTLPYVEKMLTDIGDEQSIEASLSTYAGHLQNLRAIVEEADEGVMVLIDELGSGTDPDEGAALSQAVVETVLRSGARGLVNTHLAPLKVFASETGGVQNAAMQFDVEKLSPRYELLVGQPGRSYALAIAERLGLPKDLLERASDILGPEGERLESLLATLEAQRESLKEDRREAEEARAQAEQEADVLRDQIDKLRAREDEVLAAAAEKADEMLHNTLQQAKELKRTATRDREKRSSALEELQSLRKDVRQKAEVKRQKPRPPTPQKKPLQPGTTVYVETYGAKGPIVEIRGDDLVVQLGLLKVNVARKDVKPVKEPEKEKTSSPKVAAYSAPARFDNELNIRGERVEAGIEKVRDFIIEAKALKVPSIRILHGKGTGALRDAIRNYLRDEQRVEKFEDAVPYEGGHGVTVAYIRQ